MSYVDNTILAFSAEHVTRITGLSNRQLAYWDSTGFFKTEFASFGEGRSAIRVYSFRDVVSLKTVSVLKNKHNVTQQHLRYAMGELAKYSDAPFAKLRLTVCNREIHFHDPKTGDLTGVRTGQFAMVAIIDLINEVKKAAFDLTKRKPEQIGKTEQNRNISHNKIVIAGTRIAISTIEHFLEDGYAADQILKEYPSLTREDVELVERRRKSLPAAA